MITRRSFLTAGLALAPLAASRRLAWGSVPTSGREGCVRLPDGRKLGYADYGNPAGPLVLYFHGTPGARIEAQLIAPEIEAAGVRLVAVERPGIGLSTFEAGRTILMWPADVEHFVAALGYEGAPFGIVGLSGGACYALACLHCIPHRLTHVALVSGHAPMSAPVQPGSEDQLIRFLCQRPRLGAVMLRAAIRKLHRNPERFVRRASENWAEVDKELILCHAENRQLFIRTLMEATRCGEAGVQRAAQLLGSDWGFRLCDLPAGSVSIWQGACDPIAPPSMGHYFHQQIAGSELVVDPKAGHLTMPKWHAPEILARFAGGGEPVNGAPAVEPLAAPVG